MWPWIRHWIVGPTDAEILAVFAKQPGPISSLDVTRALTPYVQGTIYPALRRVEASGRLTGYWDVSPEVMHRRGGRPARMYQLAGL